MDGYDSDERNPETDQTDQEEIKQNEDSQTEGGDGQQSTSEASTQPTKAPRVAKRPLKSIAPFLYVSMFNYK